MTAAHAIPGWGDRRMLTAVAAMAAVVVLSNVLVQFLLGDWLTWGALTYPCLLYTSPSPRD